MSKTSYQPSFPDVFLWRDFKVKTVCVPTCSTQHWGPKHTDIQYSERTNPGSVASGQLYLLQLRLKVQYSEWKGLFLTQKQKREKSKEINGSLYNGSETSISFSMPLSLCMHVIRSNKSIRLCSVRLPAPPAAPLDPSLLFPPAHL